MKTEWWPYMPTEKPTTPYTNHFFIDSGAHGLYNEHVFKARKGKIQDHDKKYSWFIDEASDTGFSEGFLDYLDTYGKFVQENEDALEIYANVDVIFSPELTWQSQQYLEQEWGISPIPVIHYGTPLHWLEKYLEADYEYIALGGIGQEISHSVYRAWADRAFDLICAQPSRKPLVKVHGFALTSVPLMRRYPWYSVDSTSWISFGAYGQIIVPPRRQGNWVYDETYQVYRMSTRSSTGFNKRPILLTQKEHEKQLVLDYINEKGFPLGVSEEKDGEQVVVEPGLCNDDKLRTELNALYFIDFAQSLPTWPWPFIKPNLKSKQSPML